MDMEPSLVHGAVSSSCPWRTEGLQLRGEQHPSTEQGGSRGLGSRSSCRCSCGCVAGSPPGRQRGLSRSEHAADPRQPRDGSRNMGTPERTNSSSHRSEEKAFCKDEATATCKPTSAMVLGQAESRKTVFSPSKYSNSHFLYCWYCQQGHSGCPCCSTDTVQPSPPATSVWATADTARFRAQLLLYTNSWVRSRLGTKRTPCCWRCQAHLCSPPSRLPFTSPQGTSGQLMRFMSRKYPNTV